MRKLLLLLAVLLPSSAFAQRECANNPPNIAIAVTNERGNDTIVHETICWNPATNTISIPSLAGGGTSFSAITGGTNVAALIIGTGGSLTTSGTGTIVATSCPTCTTTFPINLPDGSVTTPQLSSSSHPTDGFYIAAGQPNWIFEVSGTQVFAFRGSVSGSVRAIALGSSASLCFANGNTLDGNASANCDGYLHRVAANEIGFGSTGGANDGTITTGTFLPTVAVSLPDGGLGNSAIFWTSEGNGQGFYNAGGTNQLKLWGDNGNLGSPLWGWTGADVTDSGLFVISGYIGFSDGTTGNCTFCLIGSGTGLQSAQTGAHSPATFTALQYLTSSPCSGQGSAANPSLVSCSSSSAGVFSCATTASTGTCVVSSTAVTASSTILVNPSSAEGTQLAVTCNTAPTLVPTILLKSKTAGSFTINMPTITVNPECFTFLVVN